MALGKANHLLPARGPASSLPNASPRRKPIQTADEGWQPWHSLLLHLFLCHLLLAQVLRGLSSSFPSRLEKGRLRHRLLLSCLLHSLALQLQSAKFIWEPRMVPLKGKEKDREKSWGNFAKEWSEHQPPPPWLRVWCCRFLTEPRFSWIPLMSNKYSHEFQKYPGHALPRHFT